MSSTNEWLESTDPKSLPARIERVLKIVLSQIGTACGRCGETLCGHDSLFSLSCGHEEKPLCLSCLAAETDRDPESLRDELAAWSLSKPCLVRGWRLASLREGFDADETPTCLWPRGGALPAAACEGEASKTAEREVSPEERGSSPPSHDELWDAGDLGCGELVLKLRKRLASLLEGAVLQVIATDPGAPEDLPAWCRLTGNELIFAEHPRYYLRRKA